MRILVTGGAGYIGSHCVRQLVQDGQDVVVIDNLSRGHRNAVHRDAAFYQMDLTDTKQLTAVMREHEVEAVMHFAALSYVCESVRHPRRYLQNNTAGTIHLLEAIEVAGVKRFVFSSTCSTYGIPERLPLDEQSPQRPCNPYGQSKLLVEKLLRDLVQADPSFGCIALRYFNVAGCSADGALGEDHDPHLRVIPILLETALGQRESFTVNGDDFPTPDGTCIRDYIHVDDICSAHRLALDGARPGEAKFFNVGLGHGYSVNEVISSVRRVTQKAIPVVIGPRREGDPAELFANSQRIRTELGWVPRFTQLDDIVETAWRWFRNHPEGYRSRQFHHDAATIRSAPVRQMDANFSEQQFAAR